MAQKSQTATQSEAQANSGSRTSSAKEGAGTPSSARQSASSTSAGPNPSSSSSSSSSSILPRMSDPTPPVSTAPVPDSSQPQPQPPPEPQAQAMEKPSAVGSQPSPYGTRSRNRTGAARPNYAEDKDFDLDLFDVYPRRKDDDAKKSSSTAATANTAKQQAASSTSTSAAAANATQGAPRAGNGSSRKPLPDESRQHNGTKDHHPNANQPSTASASTTTNGTTATNGTSKSKKRKAADASSTASGNQTPSATNGASMSLALQKRLGVSGQGSGNATPSGAGYAETNMLTFEKCKARPTKDGKMVADDGTVLEVNDHVYLVCEPPGEPYYLGRIMEFLHVKNDPTLPIDALRINWYYRPKDIGRKVQDTRLVFATMHSDISPLTSLRGKCQIRHKADIENLADYKRTPDCFWYEKLYDRYIQKNYEVIPTKQVINVPEHVKKVLDERWKYVLTEQGRGKELTSAVKTCKRCTMYCANNDSVDCAVCQNTYHMNCVKPPLLKKPSRGFAWSCATCSRAQERKLEARNTPNISDLHAQADAEEDEPLDDDDEELVGADAVDGIDTGRTSRTSPVDENAHPPPTAEQIYHASLWPYRYLGMHCKVEDALDLDDRIFPRASTRLGLRHQAVVPPWYGRPVRYVKPLEFKKSGKNNSKLTKEQQAALEAERLQKEKRPKWIQDEPPGYVERGGDDTATLLFKPPEECGVSMSSEALDDYMSTARSMAVSLGLPPHSTNLQDVARDLLFRCGFDPARALEELAKTPKAEFKEPELTPAEQKKFEEGVAKYGSELHSVKKHVKTLSAATITRYYYTWKKTERGKQIWGNFSGRKGKKDAKKAEAAASKLADDIADDHDDSAFDNDKAREKKKSFMCKFCGTKSSRRWRRAPAAAVTPVTENGGKNGNKEKKDQYIQALCRRCAELWRRYAIQWEDSEELAKKVAQTGGRGWRRRVDEDLYRELVAADEMASDSRLPTPDPAATASPASTLSGQPAAAEPPRKKLKSFAERDAVEKTPSESGSLSGAPAAKKKEKATEKQQQQQQQQQQRQPPAPPPAPEIPKPRTLPCAICGKLEPLGDQHLSCKECRLAVHRSCYGVVDNRAPGKWACDMCTNDKNPQLSIHYKCVLCPVEYTAHDFVEPPKISTSHKKKTEKERERERMERENAQRAADYYRKKQEEMNRPLNPREPLKRTAGNNWVHVTCAVWTPEVKFGNAKALSPSEGIPLIPRARYAEVCKVCKTDGGACVHCHQCHAPVHVECARQAGYVLGFDITPVKSSRRDQFRIVTINGESGTMTAGVWCKDHLPTKTTIHRMDELVAETGTTALQLYVQNFKQADLTLTGCARKANQITVASKMSTQPSSATAHQNRRASLAATANGDHEGATPSALQPGGKICLTCGVDVSPKWHAIDQVQERELTNGYFGNLGSEAQKFVEQRSFQCHKCKKAGRRPAPHPPAPREPTPSPEPARQASQVAAALLPPVRPDEPRHARAPYGWPAAPSPSPAVQAPLLQAPAAGPLGVPIAPPAVQAQPVAPPPLPPAIAPRAPPVVQPPAAYAPSSRPFDWHRPSAGHGPPPLHPSRDINGRPSPPPTSIPPLAPPNHLRPPPISIPHPSAQSPPTGHMTQPPFVNSMPPSPRHVSGPPPPTLNGGPYHPHHNHPPADLRPHHMIMNSMVSGPPPPEPSSQPLNFLRQWGGHQSHHHHGGPHHRGSPPPPPPLRDNGPPGPPPPSLGHREPAIQQPPPAPPAQPQPQRENRPASGASASPSLRNLLS
ncbi:uncharacterized protein THITE_2113820 [Thermothielavioides terrestris NRRL 8126]|uniref:Uncharacterized protein n=1 Tax=Thermothielavioides terrestris (strain ATCC 38088 / NRRL 8126) TaxID=578455 RepID=G2R496_THETT|nr:uncharacterized protein THITE_2113820 [Thermothielavioides terrestris NRRL 8126]AEO66043.1 hypothetical protein THITE_2113820 [Thermothielavioides terrestris NRRL 8126]